MKCPKCGYTRRMGETAPDWQCPSCGVAYAKAEAGSGQARRARVESSSSGGGKILGWLIVLALGGAAFAMMKERAAPPQPPAGAEVVQTGTTVIMYSLTTCPYCTQKRAQLRAEGIPFVEYFVDREPERFQELTKKLEAAGMRGGGIGTPTFDVNGTMLLNNPSLATIRKYL